MRSNNVTASGKRLSRWCGGRFACYAPHESDALSTEFSLSPIFLIPVIGCFIMAASVRVPGVESEKSPYLTVKLSSPLRTAILALLVAVASYVACWLGEAIILHSQGISVLWPACAVLVSAMLLVPRRTWPVLIPAGLAGFVVHDLRSGFALWQIVLLNFGDTIEILIVGLGLRYFFNEVPRLNSLKGLAKYCFFAVFLGPFVSSFVGAAATPGSYVVNWRLWFFSDALAYLTLTPAILSWARARRVWTHRSLHSKLEAAALVGTLAFLGYFIFLAPGRTTPSVLIYGIVPFLLWAAVRFGSMGVSTSMIVISFLSIRGAIYGHGPFSGPEPHRAVLSLQLFLMFAAIPFMVLAALAEERERHQKVLRESEERFRIATQAGKMFAYSWDAATDVIERSGESTKILGIDEATPLTGHQAVARVHADDREGLLAAIASLSPEKPFLQACYRIVRPDESLIWVERHSQASFDEHGKMKRIVGMIADVTERKMAEHRLRDYEEAVECAEDIIGVIDRQYRLLLANRQYLKMRNLTREQVVGHFATDILNKETFETVIKPKLDECFQGKVVRYEMKFSYPTVGERDLLLSYFPIEGISGVDRVACVLHDITDRKRAEEALLKMNRTLEAQGSLLRSGQELLRVFVKNVPAAVAMLDRDMRYLQVSDRWCSDYLPGTTQILGRSHYEIFPDMPERWKEVHRRALQGETLRAEEDRWDGQDGPHWARWEVRPWTTPEGAVGGILILAEDITRRKQMEEALSDMSRKLIESQEQERARIGRELHDDINQRLGLLAIELGLLRGKHNDLPSEVRGHMQELQQLTADISSSVHALSHELHASTLDTLGLAKSMKSWCEQFGRRQQMEIDFKSQDLQKLPREISLCLLRVLQEAMNNASKHSGVRRVEVQLAANSGEIHLIVSDSGKGFDVEAAKQKRGLGLMSMQERVRLVGGTIVIDSKPLNGTAIQVCVPFSAGGNSQKAHA